MWGVTIELLHGSLLEHLVHVADVLEHFDCVPRADS
jgi:hypothetical protein